MSQRAMPRFRRWWSGVPQVLATKGASRRSEPGKAPRRLRPALLVEALEDRFLPSTGLQVNPPAPPAVTASLCQTTSLFVADQDYTTAMGHTFTAQASNGLLESVYGAAGSVHITELNDDVGVGVRTTLPSGGVVTVNADGSFSYTPPAHYMGTDSFKVTVSDGTASTTAFAYVKMIALVGNWWDWASSGQTLTVSTVGGLLDSSTTSGLSMTAINGYTASVGTPITLPSGAALTVNADGSLSYTASADYSGDDSFTFAAGDGVNSTTATASIYVSKPYSPPPPPPPPTDYVYLAGWREFTAVVGQPLNVTAAAGMLEYAYDLSGKPIQITQIDGNALHFGSPLTLPSGATLTVNGDGSFTYLSNAGQGESYDYITFTAGDAGNIRQQHQFLHIRGPEHRRQSAGIRLRYQRQQRPNNVGEWQRGCPRYVDHPAIGRHAHGPCR
jgi:YD repeat-containing protein